MENKARGEFTIHIGELEITICPSYQRRIKAEAALGRSVQGAIFLLRSEGIKIDEQANFLYQLSKPRVKLDVIGEALANAGALKSSEILGEVLTALAKGNEDDDAESSDEDDAGGK